MENTKPKICFHGEGEPYREEEKKYINFLKNNWFKVSLVVLILSAFGWYQIRPAIIKNKCSWIRVEENNLVGIMVVPNTYTRKANSYEYKFCLQNNGL